MELDHVETDPREVLDPSAFDGVEWAKRLRADDPAGAREAFVADLRQGATRTAPETDGVALRRRWLDAEPGYRRGFDLDPDAVVEGRHVGVYGIEHRFEDRIDWFARVPRRRWPWRRTGRSRPQPRRVRSRLGRDRGSTTSGSSVTSLTSAGWCSIG
jgi:hypothetical protein